MKLIEVNVSNTGDFWKDINASNNILEFVRVKKFRQFDGDLGVKVEAPLLFFANRKGDKIELSDVISFSFNELFESISSLLKVAKFSSFVTIEPISPDYRIPYDSCKNYVFGCFILDEAKTYSDVSRAGLDRDWFLLGELYRTKAGYSKVVMIPVKFADSFLFL